MSNLLLKSRMLSATGSATESATIDFTRVVGVHGVLIAGTLDLAAASGTGQCWVSLSPDQLYPTAGVLDDNVLATLGLIARSDSVNGMGDLSNSGNVAMTFPKPILARYLYCHTRAFGASNIVVGFYNIAYML